MTFESVSCNLFQQIITLCSLLLKISCYALDIAGTILSFLYLLSCCLWENFINSFFLVLSILRLYSCFTWFIILDLFIFIFISFSFPFTFTFPFFTFLSFPVFPATTITYFGAISFFTIIFLFFAFFTFSFFIIIEFFTLFIRHVIYIHCWWFIIRIIFHLLFMFHHFLMKFINGFFRQIIKFIIKLF